MKKQRRTRTYSELLVLFVLRDKSKRFFSTRQTPAACVYYYYVVFFTFMHGTLGAEQIGHNLSEKLAFPRHFFH